MIHFRFMLEYLASPIFCDDIEEMGHVDIEELAISEKLKKAIEKWNNEFQMTFDDDYPPDSGFTSREQLNRHIQRGKVLVEELREELGAGYEILYVPINDKWLKC